MGLRERKKLERRDAIVAATLQLCTDNGFDATTVDAIAERADVSRRTFFRFFPAKENAVIALDEDLFAAAVGLFERSGRTATAIELVGEALVEATTLFDDAWHARFVLGARLHDAVPHVEAVGLELCARTAGQFRAHLRPRLAQTPDHVLDLALEAAVSGWRLARAEWLGAATPTPAALRKLVRRNVKALSQATSLVVTAAP
ncbi:TetR/AcrR family transcriptional regulator [Lentzea sp. NPDC060358]|uniref:TetR/AcrR family transcriptional regulator n=1 Tax=Lentzea sp. NPDC060358 TaxID=3347103 RepID=UPI0036470389